MRFGNVAWMLAALWGAGCGVTGNGQITTETRSVPAFTEVDANNGVEVSLVISEGAGDPVDVTVEAEANLLDHVETILSGDMFLVDVIGTLTTTEPIRVSGVVDAITWANANNSAHLVLDGLWGPSVALAANNAGHVEAIGEVDALDLSVDGAASIDGAGLTAETAAVDVNNGATATVCITKTVTGTVDNGATLIVQCGGDTSGVTTRNGGSLL